MNTDTALNDLQSLLDSKDYSDKKLRKILKYMMDEQNIRIELIDYSTFSGERLEILHQEKVRLASIQKFTEAAIVREMEKECEAYIESRKEYNIETSCFKIWNNWLFYFCIGNSRNDDSIRKVFQKLISIKPYTIEDYND